MPKRKAFYVLSTHWDREWYLPMQDFRRALVRLLDRVLGGLADGRLRGPFTCDGQAILVEDYLEVRPERRAEVERLVRAGLLVIGPWYTVPDEFLISGESIVRNLRLGRSVARALGGTPSSAGWVCDQFGHISQLPQLFAGFGIGGALLWRGVNYSATRHFRWRGADGTMLPTYRFGKVGYCSFAFEVRRCQYPDHGFDAEQTWEDLDAFVRAEADQTAGGPILLFDGGDHLAWDEQVYRVLEGYGQWPEAPVEIVHSSLDGYLEALLADTSAITHEVSGELREPALPPRAENEHWLIPGVLSSRVPLKQENAACESLLTDWAEPLSVWAALALGREYPQGFLDLAWRWLLQNHPHDSLGGCSIDLVHSDMGYRFSQCRQIAVGLADEAARALALGLAGAPAEGELRVVVFNPLPTPLSETTELELDIPTDWPLFNEFFGFEPKPAFRIYGPDGAELPYQRLGQQMGRSRLRTNALRFPDAYPVNIVRVSLPLELPALGYTALTVRPGALDPLPPHPSFRPPARPTRHPAGPGLATGPRSMENTLLRVLIAADGTLTLEDKRSGALYPGLLAFEDSADIGDGWYHGPALADEVHITGSASVALVHDGPQLTSFRIRTALRAPACFDFAQMRRSDELVELMIDSVVSLRPASDRLEVETTLRNTAADHRLRLRLPSGAAAAETYLADSAFDVVERPIALRADNHTYRELEVEGRPQQSWTAVYAAGRGLAVVAPGLLESAVRDQPDRPIALTLLRSTRRTVMTDGEPEGLLLGEALRYRYWIVPLAEEPARARLGLLGRQLAAGLRAVQLRARDAAQAPAHPAAAASLLQLDGPLAISSLTIDAGALELRLWNPTDYPITLEIARPDRSLERPAAIPGGAAATLRLPPGYTNAQRVNLEGTPLEEGRPLAGMPELRLGSKQILTLRLLPP